MTISEDRQKNLELLEKTVGMTANQRLVVMLYALHPTDRSGAVLETAAHLAKLASEVPHASTTPPSRASTGGRPASCDSPRVEGFL